MSKYNLFFLIGLVGGFLIGAAPASVQANIVKVGPQPIIPTDIAKGTLFVKPNGSGEICSVANPCDIRTAIAKASGGDVVFLRGGTYTFSKTLNFWSKASAENPIIFESYPGETAVFDGSQHAKGTKIFLRVAGKFIQLRGLEVKNMPSHGIFIEGTDNLIEGVRVHGSGLDGIKVFSPYEAFPYGEYGSRNIIRNCTVHNNSDVGFFTDGLNNGWNADGISIASGTDNRVENCLVYHNSDDGIDSWRSVNTYIGYNIVHSNGIADGDGNGIKAGGQRTDSGTVVEYNLSYSNKAVGITHNTGVNLTFSNNTTWNNKASYTIGSDTVATNNIGTEASKFGSGIETDNSWQRSGSVAFVSYNSSDSAFLVPVVDGGFDDIGALPLIKSASVASVIGPQPFIPTDIAEGTLFVKPNGSGEICSVANPCDIRTAIAKASGGDVVFLRGGTYTFSKTLNFWSKASAENPIIFESYPGETAVFDGSQHAKGTKIFLRVAGKFIQLRGLEVKNMPSHGIFIEGTDNLIEGVRVHGSGLDGIKVFSPYEAFPYGEYGSRNIIRNCTVHNNSDVGFFTDGLNNGWNADGISIASGTDNRVENCLVYHNSDDGIDSWRSVNTYIGYNIVHSNGIADGDGNGIKAGGQRTDSGTVVEYNLSYSNKAVGITHNTGVNLTFSNNTTWNNKASYTIGSDTVATNNIGTEASKFGSGIEIDNSWQRSGSVAFVSTDSRSANFLVPENDGGFEDIGALANATSTNTTDDTTISLPDVVVTQVSYANGIFTSTVKNQGNAATPEGVAVAVGYSVDGKYKTWGGVNGPLAAGASVTISTNGAPYVIPSGTHTITAYVDDVDRFEESNESNNRISQSIAVR